MDFDPCCKIFQPICLVNIDSFDLHLRWVSSNENSKFSCINNCKDDERLKTLQEQLKPLLKLVRHHLGFAMNIFYDYDFFLDNWVHSGMVWHTWWVFVAQTWKTTTNSKIPTICKDETRLVVTTVKPNSLLEQHHLWLSLFCSWSTRLPSSIVFIVSESDLLFIRLLQTKTKTGQKKAGFFVSKVLSCARAEREKMREQGSTRARLSWN